MIQGPPAWRLALARFFPNAKRQAFVVAATFRLRPAAPQAEACGYGGISRDRLLLRQAMQGAQAPHQVQRVNAHHLPAGK